MFLSDVFIRTGRFIRTGASISFNPDQFKMEETKKRHSQGTRLFIVLAIAGLVTAALFVVKPYWGDFSFDGKRGERIPAFGGWDYALDDQRKAAAALAKAGLSDYEWNEGKLLIPSNRRGEYERVLGENQAFPQKPSDIKQEALNEIGAFEPESRTKLRDLYSSARQLEKTLESFGRIESANVGPHSRRELSGFHQRNVVTATISVKTKENRDITPELISAITMAARHHLGITDNADVSIIDVRNGRSFLGSDGGVGNLAFASYSQEQLRQENLWREKFMEVFGHISGIRVATTIDLVPMTDSADRAKSEKSENKESPSNRGTDGFETAETVFGALTDLEETADSEIEPAKRSGGLLFRDEDPFADKKRPDSTSGESDSSDRYVRFRPRTVAVSIAIPESYIQRLCGLHHPEGEDQADRMTQDPVFRQKSDEVIRYVRETASTLLTPLVGSQRETENANLVEVSLYADLPTKGSERRFYPNENNGAAEHPVLVEKRPGIVKKDDSSAAAADAGSDRQASETPTWKSFCQQYAADFRLGILGVFVAFFAGFLLRSLSMKRSGSAESREERRPQKSSASSPRPEVNLRESVSESEAEREKERKKEREMELEKLFDDIQADDVFETGLKESLEESLDDEEVIGPERRGEPFDKDGEGVLFTPSLRDGEGEKDYRIETASNDPSGPHFPLSAIRDKRREEGETTAKGFAYSFKKNGLRVPGPSRDSARFQFLLNLAPEALRALLIRQRPQTIALIARSLSETARQQLLGPLGQRFREEIERRMKESDDPDEKILAAVETTLRNDLAQNDPMTSAS